MTTKSKKKTGATPAKQKPAKAKAKQANKPMAVAKYTGPGMAATGSAIGSTFGPIGSALGGLAGGLISHLTGFGAYHINSNTLLSGQTVPTFMNNGDGVKVCHREYIADVVSNSSNGVFNLVNYNVNPGLASTFPWLSTIARNFEEYEFKGLVFEYRTTSGAVTSSQALGAVIMATNYDVVDPNFTTKQAMEAYEYSVSGVPSANLLHPVECAPGSRPLNTLYVRNTGVTTGGQQLYDFGNFQIATQGVPGSSVNLGELWVSYDVEFRKPKLGLIVQTAHLVESAPGTATAAHPLGTTGGSFRYNDIAGLSISPSSPTTAVVVTAPGFYLFAIAFADDNSSPGISGNPGFSGDGGNCIDGPDILIDNSTFHTQSWNSGGSRGYDIEILEVRNTLLVNETNNLVQFVCPGLGATPGGAGCKADIFIVFLGGSNAPV